MGEQDTVIDRVGQSGARRTGSVQSPSPASASRSTRRDISFKEVLQGKLDREAERAGKLRFSAHAQERLRSRDIRLDSAGVARLEEAVDRAGQKGARDSLVLMDDLALLVSVRNRVVVTAVRQSSAKDNVFTNIDSVVIA